MGPTVARTAPDAPAVTTEPQLVAGPGSVGVLPALTPSPLPVADVVHPKLATSRCGDKSRALARAASPDKHPRRPVVETRVAGLTAVRALPITLPASSDPLRVKLAVRVA